LNRTPQALIHRSSLSRADTLPVRPPSQVREPRFGCIESIVEIGMLVRQLTRHSVSNIARMTVAQRVVFAWLAVILTLFARLLATLAGGPLVRALFQCFAFVPAPNKLDCERIRNVDQNAVRERMLPLHFFSPRRDGLRTM
jgi:hypothetical protein